MIKYLKKIGLCCVGHGMNVYIRNFYKVVIHGNIYSLSMLEVILHPYKNVRK